MIGGFASPSVFRQSLERRLLTAHGGGTGVDRARQRLAMERLAVRLQARRPSSFIVKGGFALDLRLGGRFRATRGLDIAAEPELPPEIDAVDAEIEAACDLDLSDGFEFRFEGEPELRALDDGARTLRYRVAGRVDGSLFETIHVDVRTGDAVPGRVDELAGSDLLEFAGIPPPRIRVIPLEYHFAEKMHAYTRPRGQQNTRIRDLVDICALIELGTSGGSATKDALREVFWHRRTQEIPGFLVMPPDEWRDGFALLARSVAGVPDDMRAAFEKISGFYAAVWR